MTQQHIVALGGGGFSMEPDNPLLDNYLLSIARRPKPKICYVPTASGDADGQIARFHEAFMDRGCIPSHLCLFRRSMVDLRGYILSKDIIYVGGGNTVNLLAVWRAHGLDTVLREAWTQGVVLCGLSAGSLCWFEGGITDSYGDSVRPLNDGLGFLRGSHCPHYDADKKRGSLYRRAVLDGILPHGIACDDGVALHYVGPKLEEVVSSRPSARAWFLRRRDGQLEEEPIGARFLGVNLSNT